MRVGRSCLDSYTERPLFAGRTFPAPCSTRRMTRSKESVKKRSKRGKCVKQLKYLQQKEDASIAIEAKNCTYCITITKDVFTMTNDSDFRECVANDASSPKLSDGSVITKLSDENQTRDNTSTDSIIPNTSTSGYNPATRVNRNKITPASYKYDIYAVALIATQAETSRKSNYLIRCHHRNTMQSQQISKNCSGITVLRTYLQ